MKRRLFLRLAGILAVLAGLLFYSYTTIVGIIRTGRQETEIVNATGRQRMQVQQFVRQANLALIGLSISDWDILLQQRALSEATSAKFERTMHALLNGGETQLGGDRVTIPRVDDPEVKGQLQQIAAIWEEVKRASVKVLRSNNKQLRNHPDLTLMQTEASNLVSKVDETLMLMQRRHVQRTNTLILHQTIVLLGGFAMFLLLAAFVYGSIISPLANTIEKLDKSEEQHRHLYEAAPAGLWQADFTTGHFLKVNAAMARLLGTSTEAGLIETGNLFSLLPPGKVADFKASLRSKGEIADFETTLGAEAEKRFLLVSARLYQNENFAEGAVLDITDRKRAEAELERTHKLLVENAHQAGMADIATNVLHNVGNVLNSLNVSCSMAQDRLGKSRTKGFTDAVSLLRQIEESQPREGGKGQQIADYLEKLAEYFTHERVELVREVGSMQENIDHIRTIIALQQSYAKGRTFVEAVKPATVFEEALNVNMTALARHGITVVRNFEEISAVDLEKHKVLQILVNLISNAKYAMDQKRPEEKRLVLSLSRPEPGWIRFEVSDNGVGFSPAEAAKLFQHGYTTKPDGHGFGLHSSALAAAEMKGDLSAHSDGPGCGATFTLNIPLQLQR